MNIFKKTLFSLAAFSMVFVFFVYPEDINTANAQLCGTPGSDLMGYIIVTNPVDGSDKIYISTDSWNNDPVNSANQTSEIFSVEFDTTTNEWSGQGWMDNIGWIDFGTPNTTDEATIRDMDNDPMAWGNANPIIDLGSVSYNNTTDVFVGVGENYGFTGVNDDQYDDEIGLGDLNFDNVSFGVTPCNPSVNVLISGASSQCSTGNADVIWNTRDVNSCETFGGGWANPTSGTALTTAAPGVNTTESNATINMAANISGSGELVAITCLSDENGSSVIGQAYLNCTNPIDPNDPSDPNDPCDSEKEPCKPIIKDIIEA
ncbi:MAG: hypothetical protein ACPGTS_00365 [Minisyncoccia bacterium]